MEIRIKVKKILSENFYLKPNISKDGRLYLFMPKEVRKYKDEIKSQLREYDFSTLSPPLELVIEYYVRERRFNRTDLTNMTKLVEDAFKEVSGVDDSQHLKMTLFKRMINNNSEYEIIRIVVSKCEGC